jgi:hypothetical protein
MVKCWLSMATIAEFQFRLRSTKRTATSHRVTNFRLKFRAKRARSLPMLRRDGLGDDVIEERRFRTTTNQDAFVHVG